MARIAVPFHDFFTQNLGFKVIALMLALLLWYDVTTDQTTVVEYPVPVTITVEGSDVIVTNDVPREVDVSFSGSGKDLFRLSKDVLAIQKSVEGGESDTTTVVLELQDVQRPGDLNVTPIGIAPSTITVVTDRFVEKTVSLDPVGLPAAQEGYQVVNVEVEPRTVQVRGVTSEVHPIGALALDLSQLSRDAGSFDEKLKIVVPDSLRTVTVTPDSVRIRGRVVAIRQIAPEEQATSGEAEE